MRTLTHLVLGATLAATTSASLAGGIPPVPASYPSHQAVGDCLRNSLRERLQDYNETRLALSVVLRHMAEDPAIQPEARARLIGYAANLETMRDHLPPPDPDSDAFRNFDFQLGITLTAMTLFLNTGDPGLTERFVTDRDDPASELGVYLAELESSRQDYMERLALSKQPGQSGCAG